MTKQRFKARFLPCLSLLFLIPLGLYDKIYQGMGDRWIANSLDISGKEGTGNSTWGMGRTRDPYPTKQEGRIIDNLWVRIDFTFNFWRCPLERRLHGGIFS